MCLLLVAPATAWAQPARPAPATSAATPAATITRLQVTIRAAQQRLAQLTAQRSQLRRRLDGQLTAIDRLKNQKASWRRDRELNRAQADANDTAKRLTALDRSVRVAQQQLGNARRAAVAAIDRELAVGVTGPRAVELGKLRVMLAPPAPAPKKIVIPNGEIDPLADAEELQRQAAAIAAVEKQLEAQRIGLDQQQKDLELVADLRSAHERAGELSTRDDDQPHRSAPRSSGSRGDEAATAGAPSDDSAGGAGSPGPGSGGSDPGGGGGSFGGDKPSSLTSFESSAAIALGEAIDKTTIEGMLRASRSGDPKQRAAAAKRARDAVAKRLEQLRRQRALIEARARQLRKR